MPAPTESDKLVAIVLTGGRSTRFGRDKARESVHGVPSAERVLAACAGIPAVAEDRPADGPLGAIVLAFERWGRDLIVVACDMPFVDPPLIARLSAALEVDARVPRVAGRVQPLAARYGRSGLTKLRAAWQAGERSIVRALDGLAVEWLDDVDAHTLADFDTPEDLAAIV